MPRRRRGRPGLVGTMARTAVVAGTATAVVGGMSSSKQAKQQTAAQEQQAAAESQAQMDDMQTQLNAIQTPPSAPAAPAAPAGGGDDMMTQIQKLADMHSAGILTDEEFAEAKAKILG